jgi:hypothetical protein
MGVVCLKGRNISITNEAEIAMIPASAEQEVFRLEQPPSFYTPLPDGQVHFSGRVPLPAAPPDPQMLIVIAKHLNGVGNVLETRQFSLNIKNTGVIPLQKFPFAALTLNSGDRLAVFLKPMGGAIGPGVIRFHWRYKAS